MGGSSALIVEICSVVHNVKKNKNKNESEVDALEVRSEEKKCTEWGERGRYSAVYSVV